MRSAISAVVAMPLASSSRRTAASSRSLPVSSSVTPVPAIARKSPPANRPRGYPAYRPLGGRCPKSEPARSARDTAPAVARAGRMPGPPGCGTPRASAPPYRAHRARNAACGYAPGRASPANRCAPARDCPGQTPPSSALQRRGQLGLGDDALAQQVVGDRTHPTLIIAQPMVVGLGDRLDPAPQLIHRHDVLHAEDLAQGVDLLVERGQRVRRTIHLLADVLWCASHVVVGTGCVLVHHRILHVAAATSPTGVARVHGFRARTGRLAAISSA